MTMRATPRPSCRDIENPPLALVDGGSGGGGVVSASINGGGAVSFDGAAVATTLTSDDGAGFSETGAMAIGKGLGSGAAAILGSTMAATGRLRSKSTTMRYGS